MPPLAGLKFSAARTISPRRCTRCAKPLRRMTTAPASQTCCTGCRQCAPEWTPSVLPAAPARSRLRLSAVGCGHSRQPCARSSRRWSDFCLLPGHGDADEFLRLDQVVVVVVAEVDLHEVDLAVELAGVAG